MALSSILSQPATDDLRAAYQTTLIKARGATNANPVVYFDVYFNSVYYKTITSTTPYSRVSGSDHYQVDISDAIQEYLVSNVMDLAISNLVSMGGSCAACYVKVRGSSGGTGLVIPDSPVPVQGTLYIPPTGGGGLTTNRFFVLNMALQHEEPTSAYDLLARNSFDKVPPGAGMFEYLPLSRNYDMVVTPDDYGYVPFFMHTNGSSSGGTDVRMVVKIEGNATIFYPNGTSAVNITEENVYYLPYGLKNLQLTSGYNAIPFSTATRYKVALIDGVGTLVFGTPWITINRASDDHRRIFFRNNLGHYEAINFNANAESVISTSGVWQKMLAETPPFYKKFRGANRFNVRSNETGTLLGSFPESMMWLIAQIAASPDVYLQWTGSYQNDDLIPILIADGETVIQKSEERYSYDVALKYSYANPNIHTRN